MRLPKSNNKGSMAYVLLVTMMILTVGAALGSAVAGQARYTSTYISNQESQWAASNALNFVMEELSQKGTDLTSIPTALNAQGSAPANLAWKSGVGFKGSYRYWRAQSSTTSKAIIYIEARIPAGKQSLATKATILWVSYDYTQSSWVIQRIASA